MRTVYLTSLFAAVLLLVAACAPQFKTLPTEQVRIEFGSGGGVAGSDNNYALLTNGQIFAKTKTDADYKPYGKVSAAVAKPLIEAAKALDKTLFTKGEVGNMNNSLRFYNGTAMQIATWKLSDKSVPPALVDLYQNLTKVLRSCKK